MRRSLTPLLVGLLFAFLCHPAQAQLDLSEATGKRVERIQVVNHSRVPSDEVKRLFMSWVQSEQGEG